MIQQDNMVDQVIVALRRVIRAVDLHSRSLVEHYGLTGPQALLLKVLRHGTLTAGELAARVSLSQATVTDILNRLEQRGLVQRVRDAADRRRVMIAMTDAGRELLGKSPPLLQDRFAQRFNQLQDWEQSQLLSSLQRIAWMMDAADIDASPVLTTGSVHAGAGVVGVITEPAAGVDDGTPSASLSGTGP